MAWSKQNDILPPAGGPLAALCERIWAADELIESGTRFVHESLAGLAFVCSERGGCRYVGSDWEGAHRGPCLAMYRPGAAFEEITDQRWRCRSLVIEGPCVDSFRHRLAQDVTQFHKAPGPFQRCINDLVTSVLSSTTVVDEWRCIGAVAHLLGHAEDLVEDAQCDLLDRCRQALHRNPAEQWSVEDLARCCHLSRSSFCERFRRHHGRSPAAWVQAERIAIAHHLLLNGSTVRDAAERSGFANPYHFSRVYKKLTGRTPSSDISPRF